MNLVVLQDTREQQPWDFSFYDGVDISVGKLDTGDYSLQGYEDVLAIERKASSSEIAQNLGKQSKRFNAEMKRMAEYKYKYIICEFSVANLLEFPKNSGISQKQLKDFPPRMNAPYMIKCLNKYKEDYGIEVIFAGSREGAIEIALEIFNEVVNGLS
jgi:ERCC4-type nuclease